MMFRKGRAATDGNNTHDGRRLRHHVLAHHPPAALDELVVSVPVGAGAGAGLLRTLLRRVDCPASAGRPAVPSAKAAAAAAAPVVSVAGPTPKSAADGIMLENTLEVDRCLRGAFAFGLVVDELAAVLAAAPVRVDPAAAAAAAAASAAAAVLSDARHCASSCCCCLRRRSSIAWRVAVFRDRAASPPRVCAFFAFWALAGSWKMCAPC